MLKYVSYDIPRRSLKRASHANLLRLARYVGLRYGLEQMSHRQLADLVRWKITRRWEHVR